MDFILPLLFCHLSVTMVNVIVYPEFSYAIFVAVSSVFVLFWMGLKTGMMRRKENVPVRYFKHTPSTLRLCRST